MTLRPITRDDFDSLEWRAGVEGGWQITADLTCGRCGAYQAADSDPTTEKQRAVELTERLFTAVGWRVEAASEAKLCPACAGA